MSFDVAFWRYTETLEHDHSKVLASLDSGSTVEGVALIETDAMIARLAELLSGWVRVDERTWETPKRYVQARTSPQHLSMSMSFASARPVLLKSQHLCVDLVAAFGTHRRATLVRL